MEVEKIEIRVGLKKTKKATPSNEEEVAYLDNNIDESNAKAA